MSSNVWSSFSVKTLIDIMNIYAKFTKPPFKPSERKVMISWGYQSKKPTLSSLRTPKQTMILLLRRSKILTAPGDEIPL